MSLIITTIRRRATISRKKRLARLVATGLKSNNSALCEHARVLGGITMTITRQFSNGMTRRGALKGLAATTALSALPLRAHAQETTLRWWSPQGAPAQVEAYQFQIAQFEAANPGIKVVFETTSDEGYAPQLAAAFS
jgi:hypothetical protein